MKSDKIQFTKDGIVYIQRILSLKGCVTNIVEVKLPNLGPSAQLKPERRDAYFEIVKCEMTAPWGLLRKIRPYNLVSKLSYCSKR